MTLFFPSHEITIYRHRQKGSTARYGFSATFTPYHANIQPANQERIELADGRFGKTFVAFVDTNANIKEGDQIVTSGKRYSVKGVSRWEGAGMLDHLELIITAQDG